MRRIQLGRTAAVTVALLLATSGAAAAKKDDGQFRGHQHRDVCAAVGAGDAHCDSKLVLDSAAQPYSGSQPVAGSYGPSDLWSAYGLPGASSATWSWNGRTVAIVDAYDAPNVVSDVNVYRSQYGLPPCTTASGCFKKVSQTGGTRLPSRNGGWAQETSLDVDMASAVCPNCKILLVEASSASFGNLLTAEDYASSHGSVVSNSWGGGEFSSETSTTYDGHFNRAVPITVSSGDSGYGTEYPASSRFVTAAGGTSLVRDSSTSRGWSETAWNGAGSGCSAYETKPAWQHDASCARRTVADLAAVADPATGVAVYDSYSYGGASGWQVYGGTSVAAPILAGVYALAPAASPFGSTPYAAPAGSLNDIVGGSNGSCGGSYLCTAVSGYDGPTGLGTPNGIGGF